MSLVLRYAARSDRGLIRGNNQDSVYAGPRLLAEGDAAFLAAGVWEQTGDSSSLDAAASAVKRC